VRRWMKWVLGWAAGLCLAALLFVAALLQMLRAAPGEWSQPLQLGPWQMSISVPTVLRMATHPFVLGLLEGRRLNTAHGPLTVRPGPSPGMWQVVCAPCTLNVGEAGGDRIRLTRVQFSLQRSGQNDLRGEFMLGDAPRELRGRWSAHMAINSAELKFKLPDTPLAHGFALFDAALPELRQAHIDGRIRVDATLRLPSNELRLQPQIDGFAVAGLGTEALLNALPACPGAKPGRGFGSWLPRAVVAAEDQRFFEHSGYDLAEITAALSNTRAPRGASTLSQQLAKLLFTGDERTHQRKLRELLYAVELDRTLGKARVLNLYMAIAPWGEGQCGAHAAAKHYLHKRADALTATEAAWLASLLHNPDRELAMMALSGQANTDRVGWIIGNLRPVSKEKREALLDGLASWSPIYMRSFGTEEGPRSR
jgi:hypothetical protein